MPDDADTADPAGNAETPAPLPAYPNSGASQPAYPAPPSGTRRTGLIVTGVIALVAGVGIGVGATAIATSDDDPEPRPNPAASSRVSITTPPSTTPTSGPAQPAAGDYSMASVSNACDLIDLTSLHKWATTPRLGPDHWENQPTDLSCQASYIALSANQTHYNEAGINFEAAFTDSAYDEWKDKDTATSGAGATSGKITGLGAEGYWHSEIADTGTVGMDYIVAVRDSNLSVRVRLALLRQPGEPPVTWEEMAAVARPQVEHAMTRLRT